MDHSQVIIRPVVSEKSYALSAAGKYTFRVHPDAHRTQVRQAVEALFDVHVVDVRLALLEVVIDRRRVGGRRRSLLGADHGRQGQAHDSHQHRQRFPHQSPRTPTAG